MAKKKKDYVEYAVPIISSKINILVSDYPAIEWEVGIKSCWFLVFSFSELHPKNHRYAGNITNMIHGGLGNLNTVYSSFNNANSKILDQCVTLMQHRYKRIMFNVIEKII